MPFLITHSTITVAAMASPLNSNISVTGLPIISSQTALSTFLSDPTPSGGEVSVTVLIIATGAPSVSITPVSFSSGTATIAETPHTTQAAAHTSSAVPVKDGQLTTDQVGGIAVAGFASTSIVFGLMLFIYCLRQGRVSREQKRQSPCKIEEPPLRTNQDHNSLRPPPPPPKDDPETGDGGTAEKATSRMAQGPRVRPNSGRWSFWRRTPNSSDIEAHFAPESLNNLSSQGGMSCRTISKLLPDKSLLPLPLEPHQSATTDFKKGLDSVCESIYNLHTQALRGCNSVVTSQPLQHPYLQSLPLARGYHPAGAVARMYGTKRGRHSPLEYSISMEQQLHGNQRDLQPAHQQYTVQKPPKSRHPAARMPGPPRPPNFHTPISQLTAAHSSNYLSNESLARSQQQPIQLFCLAHGPRWSETSFESAGGDESPPAETLSPVAETPHRSPFWA